MRIDVLDTSIVSLSPNKIVQEMVLEHWQVPLEVLSQVDKSPQNPIHKFEKINASCERASELICGN